MVESINKKAAMKRFRTSEALILSFTGRKDCEQSPDYNRSRHENNLSAPKNIKTKL